MTGFFLLILLIALVDQGVKFAIKAFLALNQSITVLPGILSFTYIENPGAAFGLFRNESRARLLFLVITLLLFFFVFYYKERIRKQALSFRLGLALGLGGALGNFIDRMCFEGRVIDFLDLDFWPLQNWPVFNLADSAIMIGAIIIFLHLFKRENSV